MDTYEQRYKEALERAKAYDEAIEKATQLWECGDITRENLEYIFSEPVESEDEKIRKEIADFIYISTFKPKDLKNKEKWLTWLEKQGTSYTKRDVDNAFVEGMVYAKDELEKQGNKHVWSEEDEVRLQACLDTLQAKSLFGVVDTVITEWLKSLKDRVQPIHEYSDTEKQEIFIRSQRPHFWKPTDEQMHAFEQVYEWYNNNFAPSETLTSLYNDLKKLREK